MKKYINLLPKEAQNEIRYERLSSRLLNMSLWIVISLVVMIVLMMATRIYLKSESSRVSDLIIFQKELVSQEENQALKKELTEFNTHLSNLIQFEESHAYWSEVLIELARITPSGIAIDALTATRDDKKMTIIGFAQTRDSVLQFRKNLLDSDFFEDVNFPLSNLIKPTDVAFRYTFFVDQDELLKERISDSSIRLEPEEEIIQIEDQEN
ncbi:MAG: hypothetical protein A2826_02195 [Candidatus Doudnabacteria bacterium RIFCSPHIGHO2_01_FULL_43_23]|uniref:Fimbrial assembly protein n=1 Tax=Candidatus Doudnabacteria bacterium RIFCSPHIGHO2_01_FULL_43_23 TaxID=1817822 RepID=A0A1F5NUV2_9BACT|nr:MAG: hypothetical protein A2826_02195 [Candidatus Doudnabacteria bacterium RIFCSPHIGHO2_01_FULL_43_23]